MGAEARARVEAKFGYERTARSYLALIERLLDTASGPPKAPPAGP